MSFIKEYITQDLDSPPLGSQSWWVDNMYNHFTEQTNEIEIKKELLKFLKAEFAYWNDKKHLYSCIMQMFLAFGGQK
jgi:hypothetical protein